MGACHATSKIHSSRRSSKKQNTSASSPSTDKPINNKEDNSDLDLSGETIPNADLYVTNLNISPSLVIFFGTFYKKRLTALQNADTFVSNPAKKAAFLQKLAKLNDIDIEVAHIWVKAYIDYMILMAWLYFAVEEKEMYAPFAIQQTQRLHIASFADYKAFCHVLTEGKSIIHYSPRKIVTNNQNIDLIESSYDELKESMMIYLYENSQIFPDSSQVEEVKEIWESFYETFIKNEYSFCLSKSARSTSTISKSSIQKAIAGVSTDNHNFSLATEGLSLLRAALNLSMDYKPETNTSVLSAINSDALTENEINMAKIVDEIKFPIGFSHLLSWEQVITITEAQEWVLEYKKLIFSSLQGKSIEGDFSEKVKQVWLLHMSFTRNYQKFFVEHLAKNELKMSTSFEDIEQENRYNTVCVNFYNDIIKKQEDLLNMKLATALTE